MKKIWKCTDCDQISTRKWNLKRHIKRKHKIGQPIRAYISGNSTFNFPANTTQPYSYYNQDQYDVLRKMWRDDIFYSVNSHKEKNYDSEDNRFDSFFRVLEMQLMSNQSSNANPVKYLPEPSKQSYCGISRHPIYTRFKEGHSKPYRKFDELVGFKTGICEKCLTTITMEFGPNTENRRIQDIHKCDPNILSATKSLDPLQYVINFLTKFNKIPELLFQECKDWASNTTGRLYLIARRVEPMGKFEKVQIPENYKEIPWLNKVLMESKIILNDTELYEFLSLVKNVTTKIFTFNGKGTMENLGYKIGVSTVPIS